jgi:glucosamine--fructose-6-phosphate aminotransferase (isomerizing)
MPEPSSGRSDDPDRPPVDRAAAMVRDIESIPAVLERSADPAWVADAVRIANARPFRQVLLAGLGSSRFAAMIAADLFLGAAAQVVELPAGADRRPGPHPDLLTIVSSASGRTRETVAAAEENRGIGKVIAITRDPGSPLAAAADAVAVLPVDGESSGVSSTTFVATVAALLHLGVALPAREGSTMVPEAVGEGLRRVADATREVLATRQAWLPAALDALDGIEEIAVLAPWSQRGGAEQAALHLRECPRRSAAAYETADWLHTGIYTALPGTAVLLFEGSDAGAGARARADADAGPDAQVARVIADRGARLVRVPGLESISRSTAVSLLAAALWQRVSEAAAAG